jgi:hypothetical protein
MFRCLERPLLAECGLSHEDFFDLRAAVEALRQAGRSSAETPLRRLVQILEAEFKPPDLPKLTNGRSSGEQGLVPAADAAMVGDLSHQGSTGPGGDEGESWLVSSLCKLLRHHQLDRDPAFAALQPADPDAAALLKASHLGSRVLNPSDQAWLNRHLLEAAFRQATGRACFRRLNSGLDGVLVSDVGKPIEVQSNRRARGLIRTALRATDILMDRVWQLEMETFEDTPGFVFAPITEVVEPAEDATALHPEIQRQVARIRTDLDRFSPLETSTLLRHGYCVGRKACRAHPDLFGTDIPNDEPWDPLTGPRRSDSPTPVPVRFGGPPRPPAAATVDARALQVSATRRIWGNLLDHRDWTSYVYVPILVPIIVLTPYFAYDAYQRSHRVNLLMNSLAQGNRELEEMSRLLEKGPEPPWVGAPAEEVHKLVEPDLKGFEVIQDSWITDLRNWKPGADGKSDSNSRVHHYRRLKVAMKPEAGGNPVFRWILLARDPKSSFRFPHQQIQPRLRKSLDTEVTAGGETGCRWEVDFDFQNVPPGVPVDILVEYQSSGLFLHSSENTFSTSLNLQGDTAELTAWILMPKGKEYENFRIVRRDKAKPDKVEPVRVATEYLASDYTILAFKLLGLKSSYEYEVSWTYK